LGTSISFGQEQIDQDTTAVVKERYGLRVGLDLAKPVRSLLDKNYQGFEIVGDFRLRERYYLAAELGNEKRTTDLPNVNVTSNGSYIKAGLNYNAYNNWLGMNNLIYVGGRAGFSSFKETLNSYTIYTTNDLFGDDTRTDSREFSGLSATWLELQLGLQAEVFNNVFIGINVQLKSRITESAVDDFGLFYIPGYGKTTDGSKFGAGYGYTLTYFIPLFKK